MHDQGHPVKVIARWVGLDPRNVRRALRKMGRTPNPSVREAKTVGVARAGSSRAVGFAAPSAERDAALVRGILITRLDAALPEVERLACEAVCEVLGEGREAAAVAARLAVGVVQRVQVALFPEEFRDAGGPAGLVPRRGLPGAGVDRMRSFAKLLERIREE